MVYTLLMGITQNIWLNPYGLFFYCTEFALLFVEVIGKWKEDYF